MPPIGHKATSACYPSPTPPPQHLSNPFTPQLLLRPAHRQADSGVGRGYPETKLEALSAS